MTKTESESANSIYANYKTTAEEKALLEVKTSIENGLCSVYHIQKMATYHTKKGHLNVIKHLYEKHGLNLNDVHENVLKCAAVYGHFHIVKYAVEKGANIHAENSIALDHACRENFINIVEYLVHKGAKASLETLQNIVRDNKENLIHKLIDWAIKDSNKESLNLICSVATQYGNLSIIKYIFNENQWINIKLDEQMTFAVRNGHLSIVKYFKEKGANIVNTEELYIKIACSYKDFDLFKYLIENGNDLSIDNNWCLKKISASQSRDWIKWIEYCVIEKKQDPQIIIENKESTEEARMWAIKYKKAQDLHHKIMNELNISNHKDKKRKI